MLMQSRQHRGAGRPCPSLPSSFFRETKRKKGTHRKKKKPSKQKPLKGHHQTQNVNVLVILERLEFKNFTFRSAMVSNKTFQCSMVLLL